MADDYGQYREQTPISDRLKVSAGTAKPKNSRQQKSKFKPEGPGVIKRGSREGTLWARRMKLKDSIATVETSSMYPPDSLEFDNPEFNDETFDDTIIG